MNIATLCLALKSGNMIYGFDAVKEEVQKPKTTVAGILLSRDLSGKTIKEVAFLRDKFCPRLDIVRTDWNMDQIEDTIGKRTGVIAVKDKGFWKSLTKEK